MRSVCSRRNSYRQGKCVRFRRSVYVRQLKSGIVALWSGTELTLKASISLTVYGAQTTQPCSTSGLTYTTYASTSKSTFRHVKTRCIAAERLWALATMSLHRRPTNHWILKYLNHRQIQQQGVYSPVDTKAGK